MTPSRGGGNTQVKAMKMTVTTVFQGKINRGDTVELTDVDN